MVQWYPGHMERARKMVLKKIAQVDLVLELLDARIPASSSNPELEKIISNRDKKRIIILNKKDLADPQLTACWKSYYRKKAPVFAINSVKKEGISPLMKYIQNKMKEENSLVDLKAMVVGITNTGKSTLINALSRNKKVKTGGSPGVTRGKQWLAISGGLHLLDTPGILWPDFSEEVGYKLAITGAVSDSNFDIQLAAYKLLKYLLSLKPEALKSQYNIEDTSGEPYDIMAEIGRKRGCLQSGGRIDRSRTSRLLLKDYRSGELGAVTLEKPDNEQTGDKK